MREAVEGKKDSPFRTMRAGSGGNWIRRRRSLQRVRVSADLGREGAYVEFMDMQAKVVRNANITKPQHKFQRAPENFPKDPWKPFIEDKPHAMVPLEKSLEVVTKENGDQQYVSTTQEIPNPPPR